ncbi:hypothetical protein [Roseinatronobacter sp.]|uniref:hypothetical protein n=1 Tax=Roseinatronobacter sp. TaxID=1945755 RepID=UPI0025D12C60|nr:hypothetical protein [Roseibaca sp.]
MSGPVDVARAAWGDALPDWVERMALQCAATSQNKVAARIGRSAALVSQVLRNKYPGDLHAVEELFRGHFMAETVRCPELGTLPLHECHDWMAKARHFQSTNTLRVRMYRACKRCPRFTKGEGDE